MHRVIKPTFVLISFALAATLFAACNRSNGGEASKDPDVAATVNGKPITLKEVDVALSQQAKGQQSQLSQLELATARLQILDDLIKQEVLYQRAESEKLIPTEDEVTQAINAQKQQNGMTEEQYQKMLSDNNQTEQSIRVIARKQLAVQKLLDKIVGNVPVSDKEVEDFYNGNKARFVNARGVGLAAIIIDPADNGAVDDAKGEADAQLKVDNVYQRLKSGADFATVAREKSEDQSNVRGGDIGFFSEDQLKQFGLPQDLIAKFFGPMQNGDVAPPVRLSNGQWAIFKVTDKRLQNENLTLDSPRVKEQITEGLRNERKKILNAAFLQVAVNDAKIVNLLAQNMLSSPINFGAARPAQPPENSASPAGNANNATPAQQPAGSPAASNTAPSPATTQTPGGAAKPTPKK